MFDPEKSAIAGEYVRVEGRQLILRSDTGADLGAASDEYQVINHKELGEITEAICAAVVTKRRGKKGTGKVTYETVIVMRGGKQIAVVVRLDEPIRLPGDPSLTYPFLAITNNNEAVAGCRAQSTSIRIVCWNTCSAAEAQADKNHTVFTFRHNKNWRERLDEAVQAILGLQHDWDEWEGFATQLAITKMNREMRQEALDRFIPIGVSPEAPGWTVRRYNNADGARQQFAAILESDTCAGIRDTAWGFVNAGTEMDWYKTGSDKPERMAGRLLTPQDSHIGLIKIVREVCGIAS